jgi:hypothetical protein
MFETLPRTSRNLQPKFASTSATNEWAAQKCSCSGLLISSWKQQLHNSCSYFLVRWVQYVFVGSAKANFRRAPSNSHIAPSAVWAIPGMSTFDISMIKFN